MVTLHIEHPISSLVEWREAFGRFAEKRSAAGVREERVLQPADDVGYIVVQLDFDDEPNARGFLRFLEEKIWITRDNSPALAGKPRTMILKPAF